MLTEQKSILECECCAQPPSACKRCKHYPLQSKEDVSDNDKKLISLEINRDTFEQLIYSYDTKIKQAQKILAEYQNAKSEAIFNYDDTCRKIRDVEYQINSETIKRDDVVICISPKGYEDWFEEGIEYQCTEVGKEFIGVIDMGGNRRIVIKSCFKKKVNV